MKIIMISLALLTVGCSSQSYNPSEDNHQLTLQDEVSISLIAKSALPGKYIKIGVTDEGNNVYAPVTGKVSAFIGSHNYIVTVGDEVCLPDSVGILWCESANFTTQATNQPK